MGKEYPVANKEWRLVPPFEELFPPLLDLWLRPSGQKEKPIMQTYRELALGNERARKS